MSSSKHSSKQRKHVTTACNPCRESKVKCDGRTPSCSYCDNKGRICHYQVGGDKRKLSLRFAVELLASRVGQLSQFIADQGLSLPLAPLEDDLALTNALESVGLGNLNVIIKSPKQNVANLPLSQEELQSFTAEPVLPEDEYGGSTLTGADLQAFPVPGFNGHEQLQPDISPPSFQYSSDELYLPTFSEEVAGLDCTLQEDIGDPREHDLSPDQLWGLISDTELQYDRSSLPHPSMPSLFMNQIPGHTPGRTEENGDTGNGEVEEIEELVNQLSDRMGSLQVGSDGRVRFYGPTSHFNLLKMPAPDNLTVHRTVRKDGQNVLTRLGIDKEVSPEFEEHLISLFFAWHNPLFYVVDREIYYQERQKSRVDREESMYYSEALTNAMCCLGAAFVPRYHPDFVTYPKSVSDFFADRAKALIDIELDLPCVATIQAMVVLSGHDIGCKRDARGWLYSGMAMRLSFDLGLHIDMAPHVAEGSITTDEAELRRIVFWGTYATDHLWGFFLGRPFRINMEDVTVDKPGRHLINDRVRKWSAYGLTESCTTTAPLTDHLQLLSQYRVELCEIMAPLGHALYGWSHISKHRLQSLSRRSTDRLLKWKNELPPYLQVDLDETNAVFLPHVLLLHMQYYQAIIHIHRPWMSKHYVQPQPPHGNGYIHARNMCIDAAVAISKLLRLYEKEYTFKRMGIQAVSITCSAALMLIFATMSRPLPDNHVKGEKSEFVTFLSGCFRALEEFSLSWESAKRAQAFLTDLQRRWETRATAYHSVKRVMTPSHSRPQSRAPGPKRSRVSDSFNMTEPSIASNSTYAIRISHSES